MKAGETGYIKVAIPDLTLSAVDEIIFTLKSASNTVTKTYPTDVTLDGNTFLVPLTQANTIALNGFYQIEAQINFTDNSVSKSVTQRKYMSDTLATDLVTGNEPSEGQVNEVELTTSEIQIVTLTPSYNDLTSKPSINSVTLSGNKTASDLGLARSSDIPDVSGLASKSYVDNMALKTVNGESIKGSGNVKIQNGQFRTLSDTYGVSTTGGAIYWDEIDKCFIRESRRETWDENRQSNYWTVVKEKGDGSRIYTAKSVLDGTDCPIRSGTLIVTDIKRWDNYYLVTVRSNEPNIPSDGVDNSSVWGYLLILNANDLTVHRSISFNAKCSNVNVVSTNKILGESICFICVSCQMSYFQVVKLTKTDSGITVGMRDKTYFSAYVGTSYSDIHPEIQEFQRAKFYTPNDLNKKLLVSAGFGDGVHIVDFSNVQSSGKYTATYTYRFDEHLDVVGQDYTPVGVSSTSGSTYAVAVNYPYVYCTFAQPTTVINAYLNGLGDCRVQGLLVLNISDLSNIQSALYKIPQSDLQADNSGDPKPCTIDMFDGNVYMGMGEKGIARFEVNGMTATYKGLIKVGKMEQVKEIRVNRNGEMMCRNYSGQPSIITGRNDYYMTLLDLPSFTY